ncbi:hypothetical protein GEMRC1_008624 [Eukaryota sp. GEM-RC1]
MIYSKTSLIISVNDYVANLHQVSYISTTGVDDPCCGTFDSPCASFKGVLERMGRKGKVYFHDGIYCFDQGLGKVTDVDWEVIGFGDVMIEGIDQTLFQVVHSNFSVSNVVAICYSAICVSVSNAFFLLNNSIVFHEGSASTISLNSSNLLLNDCQIETNSFSVLNSIESQVLLIHVAISGNFEDSTLILERSQLDILFSKLMNIESIILIVLKDSEIQFNHSSCTNVNASSALFNLVESRIIQNDSSLNTVHTSVMFVINSSAVVVNLFPLSSTINFNQLIVANNSDVFCSNFDIVDMKSTSSLFQVSNCKVLLETNYFQSVICKSLVKSVNSVITVSELVISDVLCDTCLDGVGGSIMIELMDVSQVCTTIFSISEVDHFSVDHFNFNGNCDHGTVMYETAFVFSKSNVSLSNVSLYHLHLDTVFEMVDSYMTINYLSCFDSYSLSLFDGSSSVLFLNAINISKILSSRVFNLFDTTIELDLLSISRSTFTGGFLNAESTKSTLQSVEMYLINEEMDMYSETDSSYLFDLSGGSFVLQNANVSKVSGSLFVFKKIQALFQFVQISNNWGSSVFNVFGSVLDLRAFSLFSTVQTNQPSIINFQKLEFHDQSLVNLTDNSNIWLDNLTLRLNSSEFLHDDSIEICVTNLKYFAINSRFTNDLQFSNIHVLDLTSSTFESLSVIQIVVDFFWCSHCQILGNSSFEVDSLFDVNSGNFSSSIVVQESVTNSTVSGDVLLSDSITFFSHVILDDVSASEFQSSTGAITFHSDVLMRNDVTFSIILVAFFRTVNVFLSDSHVFPHQNFDLQEFQILSGSGVIFDNTSNSGQIIPLPLIVFDQNLVLSSSSTVTLQILNDTASTQVLVGSTLYLDGILQLEFDPFLIWSRNEFLLIHAHGFVGNFASVKTTCPSLFKVNLTSTSVFGTIDYYVAHLNEVSYISTSGVDDPCCGTFTSPCASFKGVLARMGRKGKVYLHQGKYSFNITTKISDMDWEVIGLGHVQVNGFAEPLFEIRGSSFFVTNVNIVCNSDICFSVSNSSFSLNNSLVIHDRGVSTFIIDSSTVYVSNCSLELNSSSTIQSNDSHLIMTNVAISGFADECSFIVEHSIIEIFHSNFSNIVTGTLFYLNKSHMMLSHSFCSNSNFSLHLFDLLTVSSTNLILLLTRRGQT